MRDTAPSQAYADDDSLGGKFWLMLVGGLIAVAIGCFLVLWLVSAAWLRWGGFGALAFLAGLLLLFGFWYDRREARRDREAAS